ncbi:hypothetical protein LX32DRAFT_392898 [Colletotrichum zoysiae]|uniref:Uncharacterized protein n=1 Tax=Colletotrichum zoysiae TaxID=1216348 RepID=A0AAD9M4F8_9PEZI|nr:hypothetical protein LX32DRAFT_392898 [Colletotrichum zoysiae]
MSLFSSATNSAQGSESRSCSRFSGIVRELAAMTKFPRQRDRWFTGTDKFLLRTHRAGLLVSRGRLGYLRGKRVPRWCAAPSLNLRDRSPKLQRLAFDRLYFSILRRAAPAGIISMPCNDIHVEIRQTLWFESSRKKIGETFESSIKPTQGCRGCWFPKAELDARPSTPVWKHRTVDSAGY